MFSYKTDDGGKYIASEECTFYRTCMCQYHDYRAGIPVRLNIIHTKLIVSSVNFSHSIRQLKPVQTDRQTEKQTNRKTEFSTTVTPLRMRMRVKKSAYVYNGDIFRSWSCVQIRHNFGALYFLCTTSG